MTVWWPYTGLRNCFSDQKAKWMFYTVCLGSLGLILLLLSMLLFTKVDHLALSHPTTASCCHTKLLHVLSLKKQKNKHCLTRYFHLQCATLIYHSTLPAPLFISLVDWSWVWATCQTSWMYRGFFHVRWLKWVYRNHWSISCHGNIKLYARNSLRFLFF